MVPRCPSPEDGGGAVREGKARENGRDGGGDYGRAGRSSGVVR